MRKVCSLCVEDVVMPEGSPQSCSDWGDIINGSLVSKEGCREGTCRRLRTRIGRKVSWCVFVFGFCEEDKMVVIRGMFHTEAEQMWESKKARQVVNRNVSFVIF